MIIIKKVFKILLPLILGSIVFLLFKPDKEFYESLNKPIFAPDRMVFMIVWPILYLLMGIADYIAGKDEKLDTYYYIQLFFNLLWPPLFFKFQNLFLSMVFAIILAIFVLIYVIKLYKKKPLAAFLNIFYLLWVIFASILSTSIYLMN